MYREQAENIFKCIPMKMETFYDKFSQFMDKAILNHYDAYEMFQRVTCASNEDIMLIKEMLVQRFKKNTDELIVEAPFIKKFKGVLDNYCAGKEINIKVVMLREFAKDLEEILNLYDSSIFENIDTDNDILTELDNI